MVEEKERPENQLSPEDAIGRLLAEIMCGRDEDGTVHTFKGGREAVMWKVRIMARLYYKMPRDERGRLL